ncbi:MAG: DUF4402 domain-containing protein [Bacteroidales bacterium]|nr:DUF4402 domain-containing protein [Bacteroidales bacterium]
MYLCGIMRGTVLTIFVFVALLLWGGSAVYAQTFTKLFNIAVRIDIDMEGGVQPGKIEVIQEQNLFFGNVLRVASGENKVTIQASANPQPSATYGTALLDLSAMRAAKFKVAGQANYNVQVTLSSNNINLTRQGGNSIALSLTLPGGTSNITLNLDSNGISYFYVGGTATYSANNPRGTYTGTFNVTANYN